MLVEIKNRAEVIWNFLRPRDVKWGVVLGMVFCVLMVGSILVNVQVARAEVCTTNGSLPCDCINSDGTFIFDGVQCADGSACNGKGECKNLTVAAAEAAAKTTKADEAAKPTVPPGTTDPAAKSQTPSESSSIVSGIRNLFISILLLVSTLCLKLAMWALQYVIMVAGYNGFLDATAVKVGWVMVRDLTNMFFVVVLLLVAFGTILGLEQYEWKKMMLKIVLAAVIVNFSRIICGVIIDAAQVVMITFVNGIAATAGGNLVNAFGLDQISKMHAETDLTVTPSAEFMAAVAALGFSMIVLVMMVIFVFILTARMVVLWVLIVLSPFAFVLSIIPQTQSYASQWWKEFGNHVVIGPVVVFFLWLAFVTVGAGNVNQEIANDSQVDTTSKINSIDTAGITGAMAWDKLTNFAVAIGILMVGVKTSQSIGATGGSMMSKATDIGKKAMMYASGASAAMWAGGKAKQAGLATGKWAAMNMPVIGGKSWQRRGKSIAELSRIGWSKVSQLRNKGAEKLEESSKLKTRAEADKNNSLTALELERQELEAEHAGGKISTKQYKERNKDIEERKEAVNTEFKAKEKAWSTTGLGKVGRFAKRFIAGRWESEGRSNKRVENLTKAAESEKKFEEGGYSLSSSFGGRLKTHGRAKEELNERRQQAKGKRYQAIEQGRMVKEDRLKLAIEVKNLETARAANGGKGDQDKILKAKLAIANIEKNGIALAAVGAEAQTAAEEAKKNKEMKETEAVYAQTDKGAGYIADINLAEQGKVAAEEFLKTLKDDNLKKNFKKAAEDMRKIIAAGGADMAEKLEAQARNNAYTAALQMTVKGKKDKEALELEQRTATELAQAGYWEIPVLGKRTPSNALSPMIDSAGKELNGLESKDAAALAATWIAHISTEKAKRIKEVGDKRGNMITQNGGNPLTEEQEEKLKQEEELDPHQRATLFAAVSHLQKNGWTDDAIGEIKAMMEEDPKNQTEQEKERVKELKQVFVQDLGLIKEDPANSGKYIADSSSGSAAKLQNYVAMGGDVKAIQNHQLVETAMIEEHKKPVNERRSYSEVAKDALKGVEGGFEGFTKSLGRVQEFLQEASSGFKRAALDVGHLQLGGHQVYDREMQMYRMTTEQEAKDWMTAEAAKRKGLEKSQMHSYGTVGIGGDGDGRLVTVDADYFRALMSGVSTFQQAGNVMERTRDQLAGYETGVKGVTNGQGQNVIGHNIAKTWGEGTSDGGIQKFLQSVILPQLSQNAEAFKLVMANKFGIDRIKAEKGDVKFTIAGTGISANSYSEFIEQVKSLAGNIPADMSSALDNAINAAKSKEKAITTPTPTTPTPTTPTPTTPTPTPTTEDDERRSTDDDETPTP